MFKIIRKITILLFIIIVTRIAIDFVFEAGTCSTPIVFHAGMTGALTYYFLHSTFRGKAN